MPENEFIKALCARLHVVLEHLDNGRTQDAARIVRRLLRILPPPERRHLEAARSIHDHDQPGV